MVLSKSRQIQMDKLDFYLLKLLKRFWQERERERKARTTLLMARLEDRLANFHKMTDAKEIWEAIKSRFGVSTEDANQKFLRSLPSSWSQVSLTMRTKPGVDTLNFDDLYNNLRVFESDVKGSTRSSSSIQNMAFVSSDNTSSTNEVNTSFGVSTSSGHNSQKEGSTSYIDDLMYYFFANQSNQGNQDSRRRNVGNTGYKERDNGKRPVKEDEHKAMVTIDGEGIDWIGHAKNDTEDYALMAFNSTNSGSDTKAQTLR
nr:xylulose kinase-1 [Tanacetum cinerariifolium]